MVALQIRDVPDDVRDRLAELAQVRGQSMQALLLALVTEEARRSANVALLERFSARDDGSRLSYAESAEMVDKTSGTFPDKLIMGGVFAGQGWCGGSSFL